MKIDLMSQPRIQISKTGTKTLIDYYTGNDLDQAIDVAEREFGVAGERIGVIALPI